MIEITHEILMMKQITKSWTPGNWKYHRTTILETRFGIFCWKSLNCWNPQELVETKTGGYVMEDILLFWSTWYTWYYNLMFLKWGLHPGWFLVNNWQPIMGDVFGLGCWGLRLRWLIIIFHIQPTSFHIQIWVPLVPKASHLLLIHYLLPGGGKWMFTHQLTLWLENPL